ncbi:MAG: FAD-dependent oxidoreductase, partial [Sphingopyxis sp.]
MQPKLTACAAAGAAEAFRYVVVGAGPCGGRAAAGLAGIAGAGSVCLIGDEAVGPYERPRLSKQCLVSAKMEGPATLGWADDGLVTRYLGDAAVALDTASHVVETASGRRIVYEKLLIATGARARKLALD